MKKVVVFGAGGTGKRVYNMMKNDHEIVGIVDNDSEKWGGYNIDGISVSNPEILKETDRYDEIALGTLMGLNDVEEQLISYGIPLTRLNKTYVEISVNSRIMFLKRFAEQIYKNNILGCVAEAGVFRGEFSKEINKYFFDRECYLFDTFDGFDVRDFKFEEKESMITDVDHLKNTSEELVYNKMIYKDKVHIKKGYFPQSIGDLDEKFVFVNLDMDLYQPTLEGLRYFYPRISDGGVILIHDYFTEIFPNIEKAVDDFEKEIGSRLIKLPIGDDISMAIMK